MIDVLVTGAGGHFGSVVLRRLLDDGRKVVGLVRPGGHRPERGETRSVDLTDAAALTDAVMEVRPAAIFHGAAVTQLAAARQDPALARRLNVDATITLAQLAARIGARLVFASTDLVFDGSRGGYRETDRPSPLSIYGRTKLEAEHRVLEHPDALVLRYALMYGSPAASRPSSFFEGLVQRLRDGSPVSLFEDEYRSPLWFEDAARATWTALQSDETGLLHVAGPERMSRFEMGIALARALGVSEGLVEPIPQAGVVFSEPRPADVSLDVGRYRDRFGEPGHRISEVLGDVVSSM